MTFEEFKKNCSIDVVNEDADKGRMELVAIFSAGYIKEFSIPMFDAHKDFCTDDVLRELYEYLNNQFKEN